MTRIMADNMSHVNEPSIVVTPRIRIPVSELRLTFSRSSGPGGQNVNKVNSKVTIHWNVTANESLPEPVRERFLKVYANRINAAGEVILQSQRYREQERNRADCMDKLRDMVLAVASAPKTRRKTKPSRASRERRLQDKHHRSETKRLRRGPND